MEHTFIGIHNGHDIKALISAEGQFDQMYDILCNNLKEGETVFSVNLTFHTSTTEKRTVHQTSEFQKMCSEGLDSKFLPMILSKPGYKVLKKLEKK